MKLTMPNGIMLEGDYEEVVKACKELYSIDYSSIEQKFPWEQEVIYATQKQE